MYTSLQQKAVSVNEFDSTKELHRAANINLYSHIVPSRTGFLTVDALL